MSVPDYKKHYWIKYETITADKMNNIEDQLDAVSDEMRSFDNTADNILIEANNAKRIAQLAQSKANYFQNEAYKHCETARIYMETAEGLTSVEGLSSFINDVTRIEKNTEFLTGITFAKKWYRYSFWGQTIGNYMPSSYTSRENDEPEFVDGETWDPELAELTLPRVTSSDNFVHSYLPCSEGDIIYGCGEGGRGPRQYGFLDIEGKIIKISSESMAGEFSAVAPENAAWAYINTKVKNSPIIPFDEAYFAVETITPKRVLPKKYLKKKYFLDKEKWVHKILAIGTGATTTTVSYNFVSPKYIVDDSLVSIQCNPDYNFLIYCYNRPEGKRDSNYVGYWNGSNFNKTSSSLNYYTDFIDMTDIFKQPENINVIRISYRKKNWTEDDVLELNDLNNIFEYVTLNYKEKQSSDTEEKISNVVLAQKQAAQDWHFPFIDLTVVGFGSNHYIPGTRGIWDAKKDATNNTRSLYDLNQKEIWMSDGVHPHTGIGTTEMYARTFANQLQIISPSYYIPSESTSSEFNNFNGWGGKKFLWLGTSVPAGEDETYGDDETVNGLTYPQRVVQILNYPNVLTETEINHLCFNKARGSSCLRINSSTGTYDNMAPNHFFRALTRTLDECDSNGGPDTIQANWNTIRTQLKYDNGSDLSNINDLETEFLVRATQTTYGEGMRRHSYETLLLPYLDGTNTMPDVFVIDHGHNDRRPVDLNNEQDILLEPTLENIADGKLAEDTYMVKNNYANLKKALGLSQAVDRNGNVIDAFGNIPAEDLPAFAASLNRNCFKGAINFIITVILRYNPQARIILVSTYL